ncbi:hypothetical protein PRIPAC_93239 [Pristionchus pacificus]|uniref:Uncharacterized protein n=1 Tax=Pristionchus pacificus TaxID=54126 RepID=A0A2A6CE12_PRIPA|nr:hypothetical protein PRIPAC_93239 [Pristionchus pacificus]|eukprot:PDM76241.1 hypothetical protein PRIPAC_39845 [Pristionchus pacificus]
MRASIVILAVVAAGIAASFNDTDSNPALLRRMRRQCPCFGQTYCTCSQPSPRSYSVSLKLGVPSCTVCVGRPASERAPPHPPISADASHSALPPSAVQAPVSSCIPPPILLAPPPPLVMVQQLPPPAIVAYSAPVIAPPPACSLRLLSTPVRRRLARLPAAVYAHVRTRLPHKW